MKADSEEDEPARNEESKVKSPSPNSDDEVKQALPGKGKSEEKTSIQSNEQVKMSSTEGEKSTDKGSDYDLKAPPAKAELSGASLDTRQGDTEEGIAKQGSALDQEALLSKEFCVAIEEDEDDEGNSYESASDSNDETSSSEEYVSAVECEDDDDETGIGMLCRKVNAQEHETGKKSAIDLAAGNEDVGDDVKNEVTEDDITGAAIIVNKKDGD